MSSAERYDDTQPEKPASLRLVEYLQAKCDYGIRIQAAETLSGDTSSHGAFIRRALAKGEASFLMKPPHPHDVPGMHARVEFDIPLGYEARRFFALRGEEIHDFYVQKTVDGIVGPRWHVSVGGVEPAEPIPGRQEQISSEMTAEELAGQMLEELSAYNIAADSELLEP